MQQLIIYWVGVEDIFFLKKEKESTIRRNEYNMITLTSDVG